ncbi:hypothetical protein [Rhizobium grahamii]|uniref:HTH iclR-type domain-containing protein n=1 Tax=Rhizobium grahamii CCGE 502 TaxID=990285 RepID=S3HK50_9HYPH|nr:hypothetical protein [Rhizobium grahamii]EPE98435.1 hypothetical protein RGCCGE502_08410 [Rhizobium grahamii CCGE 502]
MKETKRETVFVKSKARSTWVGRIRRDARVSHSAFRFSYVLAEAADETGTLYEPLTELAGRIGVHPPTLVNSLERLSGLGYISLERGGYGLPWRIAIRPPLPEKRDRSA